MTNKALQSLASEQGMTVAQIVRRAIEWAFDDKVVPGRQPKRVNGGLHRTTVDVSEEHLAWIDSSIVNLPVSRSSCVRQFVEMYLNKHEVVNRLE